MPRKKRRPSELLAFASKKISGARKSCKLLLIKLIPIKRKVSEISQKKRRSGLFAGKTAPKRLFSPLETGKTGEKVEKMWPNLHFLYARKPIERLGNDRKPACLNEDSPIFLRIFRHKTGRIPKKKRKNFGKTNEKLRNRNGKLPIKSGNFRRKNGKLPSKK